MVPLRWLLAGVLVLGLVPATSAQVFLGPPPVLGTPVVVSGGVGFRYQGRRLSVAGFFPTGPALGFVPTVPVLPGPMLFGPSFFTPPVVNVVQQRVVVQPIVVAPQFAPPAPRFDLSGIDLDREPPERLFADLPLAPPVPREQPAVAPPPRPPEAAKRVDPPPAVKKEEPARPLTQAERLLEMGQQAFQRQEYGVALLRFRQAGAVEPKDHRPLFLLAQAQYAVGELRAAVQSIQQGLALHPDWPTAPYRPRAELYPDSDEDWHAHRRRLEEALERQPRNADYLFLKAYLAWFDGERVQAARWFREARELTDEPRWIELFLKHAADPPVAAN